MSSIHYNAHDQFVVQPKESLKKRLYSDISKSPSKLGGKKTKQTETNKYSYRQKNILPSSSLQCKCFSERLSMSPSYLHEYRLTFYPVG